MAGTLMKKHDFKRPSVVIIVFAVLAIASALDAAEWGVAGTFGSGSFDFSSKKYLFPKEDASGSMKKAGAEIFVASDIPGGERLGARFSLGYEKAWLDSGTFADSESFNCFNADLTIKIGLAEGPSFRFWLGPELGLGLIDGDGTEFTRSASAKTIRFGGLLAVDLLLGARYGLSLAAGVRVETYKSDSQFGTERALSGSARYAYFMASAFYRFESDCPASPFRSF
jgi:hypothetical protein